MALPSRFSTVTEDRSFIADVTYTVGQSSRGRGQEVRIDSDESVARSLAILAALRDLPSADPPARKAEDWTPPVVIEPKAAMSEAPPVVMTRERGQPTAANRTPALSSVKLGVGQPSAATTFRCRSSFARWQAILCHDANLTALDQQLSLLDSQSRANARPAKREMLALSRAQFVTERDKCQDRTCLHTLLLARMTEVAVIMADRSSSLE